jgi:hypothetical protein
MPKNKVKPNSDRDKIVKGMEKVCQNLIDFKKKSNSDLIVIRNNQIMHINSKNI